MSDIQDNANFGLNYLTKDIRLANLNNQKSILNDETAFGGIVLTSSVNATKDTKTKPATPLSNFTNTIVGNTAAVSLHFLEVMACLQVQHQLGLVYQMYKSAVRIYQAINL